MPRKKFSKVSKKMAIILLIAVLSIAGFVSCKKKVTQPNDYQQTVEVPDAGETGPVNPGDTNTEPEPDKKDNTNLPSWDDWNYGPTPPGQKTNEKDNTNLPSWGDWNYGPTPPGQKPNPESEPSKPTFAASTYMTVYTPWRRENYPKVSWQDSETLLKIWKEMIGRKDMNGRGRWYVKGAAHGNWDTPENNYYYFDKNFDIVYHRASKKGSLKIMKLVGATIVRWNKARNDNNKAYVGTWTVGGIYQTILTHSEITGNGWDDLNFFTRAEHMPSRNNKPLQVITMNLGYNDYTFTEFGIDNYYNTTKGDGYYNNITEFTNKSPQELDNFLNVKINLSWQWHLDWHNWRFSSWNNPPAWHLEEHPDRGWVNR